MLTPKVLLALLLLVNSVAAQTSTPEEAATPEVTEVAAATEVTGAANNETAESAPDAVPTAAENQDGNNSEPSTTIKPPEKNINVGYIHTRVVGQSGKIMVSTSDDFNQDSTVVVELDNIAELDANGEETKTKFNTFANQEFEFTEVVETTYNNLKAQTFNFTTTLMKRMNGQDTKIADVVMTVYFFKESGEFEIGGEHTKVRAGSVKFCIELGDFTFGADGKFVSVAISVKAPGNNKLSKANKKDGEDTDVYSLGEGTDLKMSKKVQINGTWEDMPAGFPKLEQAGSKDLLKCRFPKFTDKARYDPTIELGVEEVRALAEGRGAALFYSVGTMIFALSLWILNI